LILIEKDVCGAPPDAEVGDGRFLPCPQGMWSLISRKQTVGKEIMKVRGMGEGVAPKIEGGIGMRKQAASHVGQNAISTFCNAILLRGSRKSECETSTDRGAMITECIIGELSATISMKVAHGTTMAQSSSFGPGDQEGRSVIFMTKEVSRTKTRVIVNNREKV
jgi:hypothetical protein